jgi:hypothetical protein
MSMRRCGFRSVLLIAGVSACLAGCRSPSADVTYNPFFQGNNLGERVESVPDRMMERLEQFDSRMENILY